MKARSIGKLLRWIAAALLVFSVLTTAFIYFYQEKIIQLFVAEANKHLKTKVQVGRISVSWWDKFPQVSVTLDQVYITEGLPDSQAPLATAEKIFCTLNLLDLLRKDYQVRELYLENGRLQVKVLADGQVNYQVFAADTAAGGQQPFSFALRKISLRNIEVSYADAALKQYYRVTAHDLQAAIDLQANRLALQAQGGAYVHTVQLDQNTYLKDKPATIRTGLVIYPDLRKLELAPSVIGLGQGLYEIAGKINYADITQVDLQLKGRNTSVQSLLALLPNRQSRSLDQYRSGGNVYFQGSVKGAISAQQSPAVIFNFGCRQASFYHPRYKQKITRLSLNGTFTNGPLRNARSSELSLKNVKGALGNRPFSGDLVLRNFKDPELALNLKADLDVAQVLDLFPVAGIKAGSGLAKIALSFSGKLRQPGRARQSEMLKAGGDISLHNVTLALQAYAQPFRQLNGTFLVRKNDLAVNNFNGWLGSSDFQLNGYFKNVMAWLFQEKQHLLIEADLESRFLDLNELLSSHAGAPAAGGAAKRGSAYRLVVSPYFDFDLNARVQRLQFRRFTGKHFKGNVRLKNQVISSPDIAFQVIGGRFGVQGYLDARAADNIRISTTSQLRQLHLDSLFYVFENFGQDFLVQRHLKGELTANINSDLYFDSYLNAKTEQMEAEVQAVIRNGQLNDFAPLQKLSFFVNRQELANLRFAELRNTFYIQRRTIFIPEMEIHSNASRAALIGVQGTHTFDQQMDYKFRIPLVRATRRDKDEAYGPVEQVSHAAPNLFLTLKGNEANYKIAYDQERVKDKIAQDLKEERQELREALRSNKPEKKKEVAPAIGEFFDF